MQNSGIAERVVSEDGKVHFVKKQTLPPKFFEAIRTNRENTSRSSILRYRGSVPLLEAQVWARECGAAIGTKEFNIYAAKKLQSAAYARLRGD